MRGSEKNCLYKQKRTVILGRKDQEGPNEEHTQHLPLNISPLVLSVVEKIHHNARR